MNGYRGSDEFLLGELVVKAEWAIVAGRVECVRLVIDQSGDGGVPINSGTLKKAATALVAQRAKRIKTLRVVARHGSAEHARRAKAQIKEYEAAAIGRVGRKAKVQFYAEVARVYVAARASGQPPTKAVEQYFSEIKGYSVPRATAAGWVRQARKHGLIKD